VLPGIPQFKEKNKEKETFQKQSAMLEEEVVKLPLASCGDSLSILTTMRFN